MMNDTISDKAKGRWNDTASEQVLFLIKHPYDRKEVEGEAKAAMKKASFGREGFSVKRLAVCGFFGLLFFTTVSGGFLFNGLSLTGRIGGLALSYLGGGLLICLMVNVVSYVAVIGMVRKNLNRIEQEGKTEERAVFYEFLKDRLMIRGRDLRKLSYGEFQNVRDQGDGYELLLKSGEIISIKKQDFTEGDPGEFLSLFQDFY